MSVTSVLASFLAFAAENLVVTLFVTLAVYCLVGYYFDPKRKNLPPGPVGLPIVGYIPFIPSDYEKGLERLTNKYGKIFSMRLASNDVVVISDFNILKKVMMNDAFNYRPDFSFFSLVPYPGIANWNGEEWKEQRKFALRILRHLGVGKKEVENAILEEIEDLMNRLEKTGGNAVEIHRLIGSSISNVVMLLTFGHRLDYEHPDRKKIDDNFLKRGNESRPSIFGYVCYMPILSTILKRIPYSPATDFLTSVDSTVEILKKRITKIKETFDPKTDEISCFIEAYLKEMAEGSTGGKYFDERHMIGNAFVFFAAGSNTTGDYLLWFLLHMMVYPDVQKKVRQEIVDVMGSSRPSISFKDRMPYTEAVILEVHRIASSVPAGLVHAVSEDVELEGYLLPKGTHVVTNIFCIHKNPEYFKDPQIFRPERFLTKEGNFVRDERVIPFGIGKRSCPGEPVAQTEIFLYVTSLLQKYEIVMPAGKNYSTRGFSEFLGRVPEEPVSVVLKPHA